MKWRWRDRVSMAKCCATLPVTTTDSAGELGELLGEVLAYHGARFMYARAHHHLIPCSRYCKSNRAVDTCQEANSLMISTTDAG